MTELLSLHASTPLLTSKTRWVYEHPHDSSRLIKVHKKPVLPPRGWQRLQDRFMYRSGLLRDFTVWVDAHYLDNDPMLPFIAPIYGVIQTDLGLGLEVAAVRSAEGGLAPTLRQLFKQGVMNPERRLSLQALLDHISRTYIVLGDLNQDNIVLANSGGEQEQWRLIDGLGERTWIPIQSWLPWVARRQRRRFVEQVRQKLTIHL